MSVLQDVAPIGKEMRHRRPWLLWLGMTLVLVSSQLPAMPFARPPSPDLAAGSANITAHPRASALAPGFLSASPGSDPPPPPHFLPSSRVLRASAVASPSATYFPLATCVPFLRVFQSVCVLLALWPCCVRLLTSLLVALTAAVLTAAVLKAGGLACGSKSSAAVLKIKALLCAAMLLFEHARVMHYRQFPVSPQGTDHGSAQSVAVYQPEWHVFAQSVAVEGLDAAGNPLHNNLVAAHELLAESSGAIAVHGPGLGLSHIKLSVGLSALTASTTSAQVPSEGQVLFHHSCSAAAAPAPAPETRNQAASLPLNESLPSRASVHAGPSASQRRRSYRAVSAAGGSEDRCLPVFAAPGASLQNSSHTCLGSGVLEGMRSQLPPSAQSAVSVVASENHGLALRERANYPGRWAYVPASVLPDENPTEDSGWLVVHAPAKCIVLFLEHLAPQVFPPHVLTQNHMLSTPCLLSDASQQASADRHVSAEHGSVLRIAVYQPQRHVFAQSVAVDGLNPASDPLRSNMLAAHALLAESPGTIAVHGPGLGFWRLKINVGLPTLAASATSAEVPSEIQFLSHDARSAAAAPAPSPETFNQLTQSVAVEGLRVAGNPLHNNLVAARGAELPGAPRPGLSHTQLSVGFPTLAASATSAQAPCSAAAPAPWPETFTQSASLLENESLPLGRASVLTLQNKCFSCLAPRMLAGMLSQLSPSAQSGVSVAAEENPCPSTVIESPTSTAVDSLAAGSSASRAHPYSALRERTSYPGRRGSMPASALPDEDPIEDSSPPRAPLWLRSCSPTGPRQAQPWLRSMLADLGLVAEPNFGGGACFWLSLQAHVGPAQDARKHVACWLRSHNGHPAHVDADSIELGSLTTEWHMDATVQASPLSFSSGLFVVHAPAKCIVQFLPHLAPQVFPPHMLTRSHVLSTPCLLYKVSDDSQVGHCEALRPCKSKLLAAARTSSARPAKVWLPAMFAGVFMDPRNAPLTPVRNPEITDDNAVLSALLQCEVPPTLAQEASRLFPGNLQAALDWACSSNRRHARVCIDLTDSPRSDTVLRARPLAFQRLPAQAAPQRASASNAAPPDSCDARRLPVPASWSAPVDQQLPAPVAVAHPAAALVAEIPVGLPRALSTIPDRALQYWTCARDAAMVSAQAIYHQELAVARQGDAAPSMGQRVGAAFLTLPPHPPQCFASFGLTLEDLYQEELNLLAVRARELHASTVAVKDACDIPLDVVGLCPFPLAVACVLAASADIAPEFIFSFYYSLAGWCCHHDIHAVFDPLKTDRRTRPRCMIQGICDSAAGKSPFWRGFMSPWFTGVDNERSVFKTHPQLWASSSGQKGLHVAQATDADLASRMMDTEGKLFWASPECWLMLDTAHAAKGSDPSDRKINFHYLLECQNGNDYGPRSIKSSPEQIHIPTTNFGMLLLGQADAVHDFWGHVYRHGSPVRNKGFEGRPLFLFAGAARETHQEQLISAECIYAFLKAILLNIAQTVGHRIDADVIRQPLQSEDATPWKKLQRAARQAEEDGPGECQVAAAKWGYSCGSHILANHLFQCSFESLPREADGVQALLQGGARIANQPRPIIPPRWRNIQSSCFLSAPRVLSWSMTSLRIIFLEMSLPISARAGTRAAVNPGNPVAASLRSAEEAVLARVLRLHKHKPFLTVTDVRPHLNSKLRNGEGYAAIFQEAARLSVGEIEGCFPGDRRAPYRLKLTLSRTQPEIRARLGLEAEIGDRVHAGGRPSLCKKLNVAGRLDLGERFLNHKHSCVPLHMWASLKIAGVPKTVRDIIFPFLAELATGRPVDMTPCPLLGHPAALHGLHMASSQHGVGFECVYTACFDKGAVVCSQRVGSLAPRYRTPPVQISIRDCHAVIALVADSWLPSQLPPPAHHALLVGGKSAQSKRSAEPTSSATTSTLAKAKRTRLTSSSDGPLTACASSASASGKDTCAAPVEAPSDEKPADARGPEPVENQAEARQPPCRPLPPADAGDANPKKGRGRPSKTAPSPFTVTCTEQLERPFGGQAQFLQAQKSWASNTVEGKVLAIRHQWYDYKGGYKVLLWCNSCTGCKDRGGWRGYAAFDTETFTLTRTFTPQDAHGDFAARKAWTPLTSTAEASLKRMVENDPKANTQKLLRATRGLQQTPVPKAFMKNWLKNHRPKLEQPRDKSAPLNWARCDWDQLIRDLGTMEAVYEASPQEWPNTLKIAACQFDFEATAVVLLNPALFKGVMDKLANKCYIKLCGDGTFRLTRAEWVVMSLGVLTKHYARADGECAFRTTFTPLLFAIANTESCSTYSLLFTAAVNAARKLCAIDLPAVAWQYHADLHPGEDNARAACLPNAARVADFAHLIGACRRPAAKAAPAQGERFHAWRAGIMATVRRHLSRPGVRLLPLIQHAIYLLRCLPTALLFHTVAHLLFATLEAQEPPERTVVAAMQKHYFQKLLSADAYDYYQVTSWKGDQRFMWTADWWCGLQRLQPGSACGTQAQESWHRHGLKKYIGKLRTTVPVFAAELDEFARHSLEQLSLGEGSLPDVPSEPYPDRFVLYDSDALTKLGRSSASQYHRCKAFVTHASSDGTAYYAMRRTLASFDACTRAWAATPDREVQSVPAANSQHLAEMVSARSAAVLHQALAQVCSDANNLRNVVQRLSSQALVAVGPAARALWRRARSSEQGSPEAYVDVACFFCNTFCLHGSCEHAHVAFIDLRHISLEKAKLPHRKQAAAPAEMMPAVDLLLPSSSRPSAPPTSQAKSKPASDAASLDPGLRKALESSNALQYASLFAFEQLTMRHIAEMPFDTLRAIFPNVPAAKLLAVHQEAGLQCGGFVRRATTGILIRPRLC